MCNHAMINGTPNALGACAACFLYGNARNGVGHDSESDATPVAATAAAATVVATSSSSGASGGGLSDSAHAFVEEGDVSTEGCCDCCGAKGGFKKLGIPGSCRRLQIRTIVL